MLNQTEYIRKIYQDLSDKKKNLEEEIHSLDIRSISIRTAIKELEAKMNQTHNIFSATNSRNSFDSNEVSNLEKNIGYIVSKKEKLQAEIKLLNDQIGEIENLVDLCESNCFRESLCIIQKKLDLILTYFDKDTEKAKTELEAVNEECKQKIRTLDCNNI